MTLTGFNAFVPLDKEEDGQQAFSLAKQEFLERKEEAHNFKPGLAKKTQFVYLGTVTTISDAATMAGTYMPEHSNHGNNGYTHTNESPAGYIFVEDEGHYFFGMAED